MIAHDLAADGEWTERPGVVGFRVKGGRVVWEGADYPRGGWNGENVRVHRIVPSDDGLRVRALVRYVDPNTPIELVTK